MNPWVLVLAAGVLEVIWAIALKKSDGFTRWFPTLITVAGAFASFWLLAQALRVLPADTSYAVWVGIGALGVAILWIILFDEPATWMHVAGVLMIVGGIALLKLA